MVRRSIATLIVLAASGLGLHAQEQSRPAGDPQARQLGEQQARTLNLSAYAELLRSDVEAQKIAILAQIMDFDEAEDKAFWPIYRDYNAEMTTLGDERVALIEEYARVYDGITDDAARQLMTRAIDLDARRRAALEKCASQVTTALSPKMALKFLQVEHQLLLVIDLQIAASLPVVQ